MNNVEVPNIPQSKSEWILAIVGMVLFVAFAIWKAKTAKKEKIAEDKQRAGEHAAQDAKDSAENLDKVRNETDDFLGRKE